MAKLATNKAETRVAAVTISSNSNNSAVTGRDVNSTDTTEAIIAGVASSNLKMEGKLLRVVMAIVMIRVATNVGAILGLEVDPRVASSVVISAAAEVAVLVDDLAVRMVR